MGNELSDEECRNGEKADILAVFIKMSLKTVKK
jgi:hypothetical protein